eukprot:757088-Hanusia_phi.AAC.4
MKGGGCKIGTMGMVGIIIFSPVRIDGPGWGRSEYRPFHSSPPVVDHSHPSESGSTVHTPPRACQPLPGFHAHRACSSVQLRAKPDTEDDDELLEECMLVMKPCDPKVTTDDEECIDEKALESCQAATEAAVRAKLANLAAKDDKEDRDLAEGSY